MVSGFSEVKAYKEKVYWGMIYTSKILWTPSGWFRSHWDLDPPRSTKFDNPLEVCATDPSAYGFSTSNFQGILNQFINWEIEKLQVWAKQEHSVYFLTQIWEAIFFTWRTGADRRVIAAERMPGRLNKLEANCCFREKDETKTKRSCETVLCWYYILNCMGGSSKCEKVSNCSCHHVMSIHRKHK